MLNIKNIERSLAKYAGTEDALLADKLKVFGALIKRAAEICGPLPDRHAAVDA